jgi:hypothetical protein
MLEKGLWAEPAGAYAILALLALALLGAAMTPGGLRNRARRGRRMLAGAVLFGAALSLLWPQLRKRSAFDAAVIADQRTVMGDWTHGIDTLTMEEGGAYRCRGVQCTGVGSRGTWSFGTDGALTLRWSDGHEVPWRVVTYHGRHRLALLPLPDDRDSWTGRLLYQRVRE